MILTALFSLIESLLYSLIIFYIGKILGNAQQLRNFLGFSSLDEEEDGFHDTIFWVEEIGGLLRLIAIVSFIGSIVTTIMVLRGW